MILQVRLLWFGALIETMSAWITESCIECRTDISVLPIFRSFQSLIAISIYKAATLEGGGNDYVGNFNLFLSLSLSPSAGIYSSFQGAPHRSDRHHSPRLH